jgi:hypothetical protein
MKLSVHTILVPLVSGLFLLSCQGNKVAGPAAPAPSGQFVSVSPCKTNAKLASSKQATDSVALNSECLSYEFGSDTLKLKHVNSALNCCADIHGTVTISNDTIRISESVPAVPGAPLCACECLFDLEYAVTGLSARSYVVVFSYVFSVRIDLAKNQASEYCEPRTQYPWGL